ncbi:hypothetical protein [Jeotgalicoccus marinus]|uniref:hypothetical protein n=1 Tax=Jeotgalicoccus marinus TaxID=516700 RepID=UPI000415FFA8|nr:hypothetical protein [Jeotgalicoccus marinus]
MKQDFFIIIIQFSVAGASFILGAFASAILLIPFEENLLQFLRKRWWLLTKKAVVGTTVRGYFVDKIKQEETYHVNPTRFFMLGRPEEPFRMYFELKLPYPSIKDDVIPVEQSEDIIRRAYYNKYKVNVENRYNFPMNGITLKSKIIIRIENLNVKPPK